MNNASVIEQHLQDELAFLRRRVAELETAERRCSESLESISSSEQRFRAIFNATFQFIGLMHPDGTMLEVNQTALSFGGLQPADVIGKKFWDCHWWSISEEARHTLRDAVAKAAKGEFIRYEVEVRGAGDTTAVVDFTLKPVFDDGNRVVMLVPEGRDITQQKQAEEDLQRYREHLIELVTERTLQLSESEARIRAILETVLDGIITIDARGTIHSFNPAAAKLFGYDSDEVIDRNVSMLMPDPYHREHDAYLQRYLETGERRIIGIGREVSGRRKDGSIFPLELSVSESVVSDERFFTGVVRDLTARKAAEESIRNMATVVQETDNMVVITDARGYVEWVNPSFTAITGYTLDEVKGQKPGHLLQGEETDRDTERQVSRAIKEGRGIRVELLNYAKSGRTYWIDLNIQPVFDAGGQLEKFISIESDITQRKRIEEALRESSEHLSQIIEGNSIATFVINSRHEVTHWNRACALLTGISAASMIGTRDQWRPFYAAQRPVMADLVVDGALDGSLIPYYGDKFRISAYRSDSYEAEDFFPHFGDGGRWIFFTAVPVKNSEGKIIGAIETLQDITERIRAREDLQQAKEAAETANRAKSEFLANMSHEIRTPLNAVIGFSELALTTDLTVRQRDYVQKIRNSGQSLLSLINDILDFSKIEAGKLELEQTEFSLEELLDRIIPVIQHQALKKGIEFLVSPAPDLPQQLGGDPLRLGQILLNLLTNAIKFTERGEVELSVDRAGETGSGHLLTFAVRDTGIGMTGDQVQRLFQPFTQADGSTTRRFGGTGLGLSICRRLVELMGGTISLASTVGAGSTFNITLPLGRTTADRPLRSLPPELEGLRILVADDNLVSRKSLLRLLEALPVQADAVDSGMAALQAVTANDRHAPYRLLMDWQMDDLDGIEATRRIKKDASLRTMPNIVMVTAFGDEEGRSAALAAGADGFMLKPLTVSDLQRLIVRLFVNGDCQEPECGGARQERRYDFSGLSLLLAEDNELNQQIAGELLKETGAAVSVVNNGAEALEAIMTPGRRFDLLLMDIQMPVMDGLEATRCIREDARFRDLPIVALTAHAFAEERQRSREAGMNGHIVKPIDRYELLETIARQLSRLPLSAPAAVSPAPPGTVQLPAAVLAGLDAAAALKRLGGNETLYLGILEKFGKGQRSTAATIGAALTAGDAAAAARAVHTIKGLAGNIGASRLQGMAAELETALRETGIREQTGQLFRQFAAELARVLELLDQVTFRRESVVAPQQTPPADLAESERDAVRHLAALIRESDSAATDHLTRHRSLFLSLFTPDELSRLEQQIGVYDFDEAVETLHAMLTRTGVLSAPTGMPGDQP